MAHDELSWPVFIRSLTSVVREQSDSNNMYSEAYEWILTKFVLMNPGTDV
jgi:hypothetical protein